MEQTRLFLALALSLGLLFAYQEFVLRRPAGDQPSVPMQQAQPTASAPMGQRQPGRSTVAMSGFAAEPTGRNIVVSTDRFVATFTPRGARLIGLELKAFKRDLAVDSPPLNLVLPAPVLPLTMMLGPHAGDAGLVYSVEKDRIDLTGNATAEVKFRWRSASGKRLIEKRYQFRGDSYRFDVAAAGTGTKAKSPTGFLLTPLRPDGPSADKKNDKAVLLAKKKIVEHQTQQLLAQGAVEPEAEWVGFSNQYFLMALATPDGVLADATVGTTSDWPTARLIPHAKAELAASVFAGPKDRNVLAEAGSRCRVV